MRDDTYQASRALLNAPPVDDMRADDCVDDGIARYLRTMHEVAHTPGMCHWCTPGHNRGKAVKALSAGIAHATSAETTTLPTVSRSVAQALQPANGTQAGKPALPDTTRRTLRLAKIHG